MTDELNQADLDALEQMRQAEVQQAAPEPVQQAQPEAQPATEAPVEEELPPEAQPDPSRAAAGRLAALQDERARRQAAEARLQQLESENKRYQEWHTRLDERLRLVQQQQQQAAQRPQVPNPDEDPIGHQRYIAERLDRQQQENQQFLEQQRQQQEQIAHVTHVNNMTMQFASQTPDYFQAIRYARDMRDKELELFGYADPQMRDQIIGQEANLVIHGALQTGRNPAAVLYEFAKMRGYASVQPAAPQQPQSISNEERLARAQRAQPATRSLSQGSIPATEDGLTLEKLVGGTEEEFFRAMDKHPRAVDKLMGSL